MHFTPPANVPSIQRQARTDRSSASPGDDDDAHVVLPPFSALVQDIDIAYGLSQDERPPIPPSPLLLQASPTSGFTLRDKILLERPLSAQNDLLSLSLHLQRHSLFLEEIERQQRLCALQQYNSIINQVHQMGSINVLDTLFDAEEGVEGNHKDCNTTKSSTTTTKVNDSRKRRREFAEELKARTNFHPGLRDQESKEEETEEQAMEASRRFDILNSEGLQISPNEIVFRSNAQELSESEREDRAWQLFLYRKQKRLRKQQLESLDLISQPNKDETEQK